MTLWLSIVCTRKPQAKSQPSQLEIWNISEEKVRFFGWCRLIKNLDHLTYILKRSLMRSSQRYIFVCSCELCMHVTVLYNLTTCISIFLPQKIRRRKPDTCHCVGRVWCGNSQREGTAIFRHQTTGKFIRYGVFQSPLINVEACPCTYGHKNLINFSVNICMYIKATLTNNFKSL